MAWERLMLGGIVATAVLAAGSGYARDPGVVRAFRKQHPCPATQRTTGACPGWVVDHLWPLCAGGPDETWNMAWQRADDAKRKDNIERAVCAAQKKSCGK